MLKSYEIPYFQCRQALVTIYPVKYQAKSKGFFLFDQKNSYPWSHDTPNNFRTEEFFCLAVLSYLFAWILPVRL